jgi:hypothetical protein
MLNERGITLILCCVYMELIILTSKTLYHSIIEPLFLKTTLDAFKEEQYYSMLRNVCFLRTLSQRGMFEIFEHLGNMKKMKS